MEKRKYLMSGSIFMVLFLVFSLPGFSSEEYSVESGPDSLLGFIPEKGIGNWKKRFSPEEYAGEDLYLYINGGAEIYHEFGFRRVAVQDYKNDKDKGISLEIYEMSSPESAFGIYTFKTGPSGKELDIGQMARLEDYYLNLWKGKFLVTLTGFDDAEETLKGIKLIAQAVDARLPDSDWIPSMIKILPKKDLIFSSIKYFMGNLALFNSYPFFQEDFFSINKGLRGDYGSGYSIFIFSYPSLKECKSIFNTVRKNFEQSDRYKNLKDTQDEGFIVFSDDGLQISIYIKQRYLFIFLNIESEKEIKNILTGIMNLNSSIFSRE